MPAKVSRDNLAKQFYLPEEIIGEASLPRQNQLAGEAKRFFEVVSIGLIDVLALSFAFFFAYIIRTSILAKIFAFFPPSLPPDLLKNLWWFPVMSVVCMAYEGLYTRRFSFWREIKRILKACTLAFLLVLAAVSLGKLSGEVSRTVIVLTWLMSLWIVPLARYTGKLFLARLGIWRQRVLILGAGKTGELVVQAIENEPYLGYEIAGLVDDDNRKQNKILGRNSFGKQLRVIGSLNNLESLMALTGTRDLIVAMPGLQGNKLVELVNRLQQKAHSVMVVPDLFGLPLMGIEADYFFNEQMLALKIRNNLQSCWNILVKRSFDIIFGFIILIITLVPMVFISLAVKLDSKGPVFYKHRRIGRGGRKFECYKFRSMYLDAEEILQNYLSSNPDARREWEKYAKLRRYDPRVTRVGRVLRKLSLDELPQIFNVLKGEMSLVGPRPYLPREVEQLKEYKESILSSRPGITGLWQVSGRNELEFEERIVLESWYVRNWSLWLDITLLLRTVAVLLARRGAY